MLNIGMLVSGGGTNLQKLIDAQAAGQIVNGQLRVVTLDAEVEKKVLAALTKNEQGVYLALSPDIMQQIMAQLGELRKKFQELSQTPIVLTSQIIRVYLSRMIAQFYPDIYVLSFNEITSNVQIQAIGNITMQSPAKPA